MNEVEIIAGSRKMTTTTAARVPIDRLGTIGDNIASLMATPMMPGTMIIIRPEVRMVGVALL